MKSHENVFERILINRFSFFHWLDEMGNQKSTNFLIGHGWFNLLWDLSLKLEELIAVITDVEAKRFFIYEVKQKYGGMRVVTSFIDNKNILKLIHEIEDKSYGVCEECGKSGKTREGSWIVTLCDCCYRSVLYAQD